jgi:hypothetical protein
VKYEVTFDVFGERLTVQEMALVAGTSKSTMWARLQGGMRPERAIVRPTRKADDIIGQTFGSMMVLYEVERSAQKKRRYMCQCACGSTPKPIVGADLKSGYVVSCGCVFRRKASERAIARSEDMTGKVFADGNVLVLGPRDLASEKAAGYKSRRWDCLCKRCNATFPTTASNLKAGFVTSCGCRKTRRFDVFGQRLTMNELSAIAGVDGPTIDYRMRVRGMSAEEAAFTSAMRTQPTIATPQRELQRAAPLPDGAATQPFGEGWWVY